MRRLLLILPAVLSIAATTPIQAGKWVTTVTIVDVAVPGAPPQVAAMMRGRPTTVSACVTPSQAARGPRAAVENSGGHCRYTDFTMSGGRIQSTMVCDQGRGTITMRSSGSFTPTTIMMESTSVGTGASAMTMHSRTVSRRVGGC